jgi:hypothetical protein
MRQILEICDTQIRCDFLFSCEWSQPEWNQPTSRKNAAAWPCRDKPRLVLAVTAFVRF